MGKLEIDLFRQAVLYRCACGRRVRVPMAEIQVGSVDYCGCGRVKMGFNEGDIAQYRQLAGLPETPE